MFFFANQNLVDIQSSRFWSSSFIFGQFPVARKLIINGGAIRPTGLLFQFSVARKLILNGAAIRPTGFLFHATSISNIFRIFWKY